MAKTTVPMKPIQEAKPMETPKPVVLDGTKAKWAEEKQETALVEFGGLGNLPQLEFENVEPSRGNFILFPSRKASRFPAIQAQFPDVREYEPIVSLGDDTFVRVADGQNVFHAFILTAFQCWTNVDDKMNLLCASSCEVDGMDEHSEAILIIAPKMIPVRGTFRKAMSNIIRKGIRTLQDVETPEWLKTSPAHAKMATVKPTWVRAYHKIRVLVQQGKKFAYPTATSVSEPCTPEYGAALLAAIKEPGFDTAVHNMLRAYNQRIADIREKFPKIAA